MKPETLLAEMAPETIAEMVTWRHHLHQHPEIAYEEHATADFVADKLCDWGIEVHRGLAGTGVVGTLRRGEGPVIAVRADMDALPIAEVNSFAHASATPGKMHACGHDGHTAMLLGAARHLAQHGRFSGTVHFIFQPAEEGQAGARRMMDEGLFSQFPAERVFAMHNYPGMPVGTLAVRPGPIMACVDTWEIRITGRGGHAAMPHIGIDPVVASAQIILGLQTIVSRNVDPVDSGVISVTQSSAGDSFNVIPQDVVLRGTARSFRPATRDLIERRMAEVTSGIAAAAGCEAVLDYQRSYPPTINSQAEAHFAAEVAASFVGEERMLRDVEPVMGGEDFAFMLEELPGAYLFIGNGSNADGRILHSPHYDFNDEALPFGAEFWVRLVEAALCEEGVRYFEGAAA